MDEDREAFVLMVFGLFLMCVLPLPLLFLIVVTFSMYRFKTFSWAKNCKQKFKRDKKGYLAKMVGYFEKIISRKESQNGAYD